MRMARGKLAFGLACAALAFGSAVAARAADADKYADVHTIGVIDMVSNDLNLQTMGLMVFDNSSRTVHTDWDMQGVIFRRIAGMLQGRFALRPVSAPADAFSNLDVGLFGSYQRVMGKRVAALPRVEGVDAYLIVFASNGLMRSSDRQGLFAYHDAGLLVGSGTVVQASYYIAIYNAATGALYGGSAGHMPTAGTFSGHGPPMEVCADGFWPGSPEPLSAAQSGMIHREIVSLLERTLPYALSGSGLISDGDANAAQAGAAAGEPSCHQQ